ncbi:MAG TPA: shikimate kinase [Clostridiales bacterium UBA8960]|jgi:shikimate kinase|nr:shikimate kinase [Clostridiales bacterium UBA8960]
MNIILIGMMGSGKSSVGRALARRMAFNFFDTDEMIEEMQGLSIGKIFELYGEKHFRNLEVDLVEKLSSVRDAVISTGGGIVMNPVNTMMLKNLGHVVYLKGSIQQLLSHLDGETANRPMLKDNTIEVLLRVRAPLYASTAHLTVEIDNKTIEEVAEEISAEFL